MRKASRVCNDKTASMHWYALRSYLGSLGPITMSPCAQEPKGWPGSTLFPENSYPSHGPRGALRASFLDKTSFIDNRGGHGEFRENIFFS